MNPLTTLEGLAAAIKADITVLMALGQIPRTVESFGDCDNYCDANCLGGLCLNENFSALLRHFGGRTPDEGMLTAMLDHIIAAQDQVTAWLAAGHMRKDPC